jgi:hypothetical protein
LLSETRFGQISVNKSIIFFVGITAFAGYKIKTYVPAWPARNIKSQTPGSKEASIPKLQGPEGHR